MLHCYNIQHKLSECLFSTAIMLPLVIHYHNHIRYKADGFSPFQSKTMQPKSLQCTQKADKFILKFWCWDSNVKCFVTKAGVLPTQPLDFYRNFFAYLFCNKLFEKQVGNASHYNGLALNKTSVSNCQTQANRVSSKNWFKPGLFLNFGC
jgi:hypothetical protein